MISDATLLAHTRAESADTAYLRFLERAAIAFLEKRTGGYFGVEDEVVEAVSRRGPTVALANEPIDGAVELESWDGSAWVAVSSSEFFVEKRLLTFQSSGSWSARVGPTRYRATYD